MVGERGLDLGLVGERGLVGDLGLVGERGLVGDLGLVGERGLVGDLGVEGEVSVPGLRVPVVPVGDLDRV